MNSSTSHFKCNVLHHSYIIWLYNCTGFHWVFSFCCLCEISVTSHSSLRSSCYGSYFLDFKNVSNQVNIGVWPGYQFLCAVFYRDFICWNFSLLLPLQIWLSFTLAFFFLSFWVYVLWLQPSWWIFWLHAFLCLSLVFTLKSLSYNQLEFHHRFFYVGLHDAYP